MNIEYETRILEVNINETIKMLDKLRATKIGEYRYKRYVYDTKPISKNKWIRLRTDGLETTLTYKEFNKATVDGTNELEIVVSDFNKTVDMLRVLGYEARSIQENKRIRYMLDDIEIDIDSWPLIPTYIEVEGKSEEKVNQIVNKLRHLGNSVTNLDVQGIYENYGYKKEETNFLSFNNKEENYE